MLDRPRAFSHFRTVLGDVCGDVRHISGSPSEDISIIPEELNEFNLLLWVQVPSYDDCFGGVLRVYLVFVGILGGLESRSGLRLPWQASGRRVNCFLDFL